MSILKTAAAWVGGLVVAGLAYNRYHDASEQVLGLLFGLCGVAWALWNLATTADKQQAIIEALEKRVFELEMRDKLPAYEWDENTEPPTLK